MTNPRNLISLVIVLLIVFLGIGYSFWMISKVNSINNFEKCKNAGYPIMEIYPEKCRTPNGKTFTNSSQSVETTMVGELVCLPHKQKDGPQTMECAFGLKSDDKVHFMHFLILI